MTAAATAPPQTRLAVLHSPLVVPLAVFSVALGALGALGNGNADAVDLDVVRLAGWLVWPLAAAVLLDARPGHLLGHVLVLPGLLPPVVLAAAAWQDGDLPQVARAVGELPHLTVTALVVLLVGVPLAFLPGRLDDPLGRRTGALALVLTAVTLAAAVLRAGPPGPAEPPGWFAGALDVVQVGCLLLVAPLIGLALVRQHRLRRSAAGVDRNRLDWFLAGGVVSGAVLAASPLLPGAALDVYVRAALVAAVPVGLVVLVLQRTVPPLDRVLVRTGLVTLAAAALASVYTVALLLLLRTDLPDRRAAAGTVTALVALALLPVYGSVRNRVLVAVVGHGHRPGPAMAALGRSVDAAAETDVALEAALSAVAAAVRSPSARLLEPAEDPPSGAAVLPLTASGTAVGRLAVLPRREGETWGRRERELLTVLATPVAQLVRAQRLSRELELARGDAVSQRLDERRRLRRDLHDGVGPLLAGLGLQADALRRAAGAEEAERLGRLTDAVRQCRREVRRLVDDLETEQDAVDDLVARLRELVDGWASATVERGLVLRLSVPDHLPPLPPDVRLAAYRITGEALANAVQHAAASSCTVRLAVADGDLLLEVRDDGVGVPAVSAPARRGVGLRSMGERARAVGGALDVGGGAGPGTTVRARFPLPVVPMRSDGLVAEVKR
jgi:signal transduction histidine kinase